jgi:hypothetical protein
MSKRVNAMQASAEQPKRQKPRWQRPPPPKQPGPAPRQLTFPFIGDKSAPTAATAEAPEKRRILR